MTSRPSSPGVTVTRLSAPTITASTPGTRASASRPASGPFPSILEV